MNFLKPSEARIPYSPWKGWKNSEFAKKIRAALGMRVDEDGNNCTYRKEYEVNGETVAANKNICHHFQQDQFGATAVQFTMNYGRAIVIDVPDDMLDSQPVIVINKGSRQTRILVDGTIDTQ